ncbi:SecY/SEC61-alpha family [Parasponia andersonii]|uniref:SecY/SEC61-alpha family n=1 Tax=Parasponia andersonii TaxID=3476 RepID=A0A2P5E532_PARAD|nr:SecY/SEC61-alpha family [Parasponia andersonii]
MRRQLKVNIFDTRRWTIGEKSNKQYAESDWCFRQKGIKGLQPKSLRLEKFSLSVTLKKKKKKKTLSLESIHSHSSESALQLTLTMGGGSRVLDLMKPFRRFLPEVESPRRKVPFRERECFTLASPSSSFWCAVSSLFNMGFTLQWMLAILASSRGTVMELGISPIVTSGMVMQLLAGSKIIQVDNTLREDRALTYYCLCSRRYVKWLGLWFAPIKLLGLIIAFAQALAYVISGMYGITYQLGAGNMFLIVGQLVFAGLIVKCPDELLQKGYGLGSAISLFIAANICENIIWKALSLTTINSGRGVEVEGAIVALIHLLITRTEKVRALREAFFRQNLPNVTNLLSTVFIFLLVIFFQGFQVVLPLRSKSVRGQQSSYSIKLLCTSNMPVILQSALVSNLYFFSHLLYRNFSANLFVDLLGKWKQSEYSGGQFIPVGGLSNYVRVHLQGDAAFLLSSPNFVCFVFC